MQIADGADPYVCSGGVLTDPSENGYGSWNQQIGFPWKDKDGQRWATLPYGNMIVAGDYACLSQEDGMYCINSAKGGSASRWPRRAWSASEPPEHPRETRSGCPEPGQPLRWIGPNQPAWR